MQGSDIEVPMVVGDGDAVQIHPTEDCSDTEEDGYQKVPSPFRRRPRMAHSPPGRAVAGSLQPTGIRRKAASPPESTDSPVRRKVTVEVYCPGTPTDSITNEETDARVVSVETLRQLAKMTRSLDEIRSKCGNLKWTVNRDIREWLQQGTGILEEVINRGRVTTTHTLSPVNRKLRAQLREANRRNMLLQNELQKMRSEAAKKKASSSLGEERRHETVAIGGQRLAEEEKLRKSVEKLTSVNARFQAELDSVKRRTSWEGSAGKVRVPTKGGNSADVSAASGTEENGSHTKKKKKALACPAAELSGDIIDAIANAVLAKIPGVATREVRPRSYADVLTKKAETAARERARDGAKEESVKTFRMEPPKTRCPKKRIPRGGAIVVRCEEEGKISEAMKAAREIPLRDFGVKTVRVRAPRAGGLLIEIPQSDGRAKAQQLVEEMRKRMPSGIVLTRPRATTEVSIRGLDPSITKEEVLSRLAEAIGCDQDDLKASEIRRNQSGIGIIWVRCPVELAHAACALGDLKMGWSWLVPKLVEARPTQCYRCLQYGHTRRDCPPTNEDRSRGCFNCGNEGHLAKICKERVRCAVCPDGTNEHRMGGADCPAARAAKKTGNPRTRIAAPLSRDTPRPQEERTISSLAHD